MKYQCQLAIRLIVGWF